jgi:predicted metal-dependent hydrolase
VKRIPAEDSLVHGIDLFNREAFFECHEVLEEIWKPEHGPRRLFLQSIIHIAVGFYHHQRGNTAGAERQLQKGLKKLAGYLPEFEGIRTEPLYRKAQECNQLIQSGEKIQTFPKITLHRIT